MTDTDRRSANDLLDLKVRRRTRIGLVSGGLGAYWMQFPDLLPQLQDSARHVTSKSSNLYDVRHRAV